MDNNVSVAENGGANDIKSNETRNLIIRICSFLLVVSVLAMGFLVFKRAFLDKDITWTLSEEGVLDVYGKGAIEDFDPLKPDEWLDLKSGESVKKIIIHEGITEIGDYAFYKCTKATQLTLPSTLTRVGDFAFMGCIAIPTVTLGAKVQQVGEGAFYGCTKLKVTLSKGLKSIGYDAFYGTATYKASENWENGALYVGGCIVDVKASATGAFTAREGTYLIADNAFDGCKGLSSITLPESTVYVGKYGFMNCTALKEVTFKGDLSSISEGLFWNCTALKSVSLKNFNELEALKSSAGADYNQGAGKFEFKKA